MSDRPDAHPYRPSRLPEPDDAGAGPPADRATGGPGDSGKGLSFGHGMRDMLPVLVGVVPFGITYAALAVERGLPFDQIMVMSGVMFAGASQFVAVELWADPLPFAAIVFAVLAVNFRHVLYGAAMSRRVRHWPAAGRALGFFALTDPNYAFVELKAGKRLTAAYYAGLSVPLYVSWLASSAIGAWFGAEIGNPRHYGIDFVVAAYFTYLVMSFRRRANALPIVAASVAAALSAYWLLGPPWHIAAGALAGVATAFVAAGGGRRGAA